MRIQCYKCTYICTTIILVFNFFSSCEGYESHCLFFFLNFLVIRIFESNRLKEENKHILVNIYTLPHTYID